MKIKNSVDVIIDKFIKHSCPNEVIANGKKRRSVTFTENPRTMRIEWSCLCGEEIHFSAFDIRPQTGSSKWKFLISTGEGRNLMADVFENKISFKEAIAEKKKIEFEFAERAKKLAKRK